MFSTPLGLLGLLAVPAIVALHLFRRRYRPKVVSALFLWSDDAVDPAAGRSREPLRRSASLLLELLAAVCLALALAGPRIFGGAEAEHLVVVLDGTASMSARIGEDPSPIERAQAAAKEAIADLSASSRVTILRSGSEPEVLAGPMAFPLEAAERLTAIQAQAAASDLPAALRLATEFSQGGEVLLLTDRLPAESDLAGTLANVRVESLGTGAQNVGVVGALRRESDDAAAGGGDEARIVVRSFSSSTETRRCVVRASVAADPNPEPLFARDIELSAGETRPLTFVLPKGTPAIAFELTRSGAPDPLALDDLAYLPEPPRRIVRLASSLDSATTRALTLGQGAGSLERVTAAIARTQEVADPAAAHLALGTNVAPSDTPASTWSMAFMGAAEDDSETLAHLVGPFLIDTTNPLVRGLTLDGVIWSLDEAATSVSGGAGTALIQAGDVPLVTETIGSGGARAWRLFVDARRSNLDRSLDWPILLSNAIEARRAALPGPVRTALASGERFHWRSSPHASATLRAPDGQTQSIERLPGGDLLTPRLDQVGMWSLSADGMNADLAIGVSLVSPIESDLRGAVTRSTPPMQDRAGLASMAPAEDLSLIDGLLLALALAALAVDWWVLRPKTGGRS